MIDVYKSVLALGGLCAIVVLSGCTTTEINSTTHSSSVATASAGSVAVSVSTDATITTQSTTPPPPPPPPAVDILSDTKKPCGTVAADAPKFVESESK